MTMVIYQNQVFDSLITVGINSENLERVGAVSNAHPHSVYAPHLVYVSFVKVEIMHRKILAKFGYIQDTKLKKHLASFYNLG
jgi:hypothetical protein